MMMRCPFNAITPFLLLLERMNIEDANSRAEKKRRGKKEEEKKGAVKGEAAPSGT